MPHQPLPGDHAYDGGRPDWAPSGPADPYTIAGTHIQPLPELTEEPSELRRRIEDAAHAANELQAALFDLEAELLRLQHIVRKASPAMMQLMQAATEVNAAGLADQH